MVVFWLMGFGGGMDLWVLAVVLILVLVFMDSGLGLGFDVVVWILFLWWRDISQTVRLYPKNCL